MATQKNDSGFLSLTASEAIGIHIRVKLSSGQAAIAGSGEESIGTCEQSVASGGQARVKLDNASGTQIVTASGSVTSGGSCWQAGSGAVSATIAGRRIGISVETATTTTGNYFEMLPVGVNS
jgi:hypothetical protein